MAGAEHRAVGRITDTNRPFTSRAERHSRRESGFGFFNSAAAKTE